MKLKSIHQENDEMEEVTMVKFTEINYEKWVTKIILHTERLERHKHKTIHEEILVYC